MSKNKNHKNIENEVADMLMDDFDKFEHIYATYWKQIVWGCVGVIIIVSIVATLISFNKSVVNQAYAELGMAKTIEQLNDAVVKYPNSQAVTPAKFRLAKLYFDNKDYDKAYGVYTEIVSSDNSDQMVWRAKLNKAYINELNGKKEDAAAAFNSIVVDSATPMLIKSEAAYSAGRLYISLNDIEKAKDLLKSSKVPVESLWSSQASRLLSILDQG